MSISEENKKKISELSGTQSPTPQTQKQLHSLLHRFNYHFPQLNWWGNTPIEPTGAGLTYAESITWIQNMIHHLSDWAGGMNEELQKLQKDLADLNIIIQFELASQLPEVIQEYDLFDLIVTGNNERVSLVTTQSSTTKKEESVFCYAFRTEYGFIEATKTKQTSSEAGCEGNLTTWTINVSERDGGNILNYEFGVTNIPSKVNRVWIINRSGNKMDGDKEVFYIFEGEIKRARFNKKTISRGKQGTLNFEKLNINYDAYWIVNVFKRVPTKRNLLHYMTLDYKVYEYDLETGNEKLLYQIPVANQDIFDPINDVIEGKSTIWAVTYKGVETREPDVMKGLCFEPCFDGVEMYDTWETPKEIKFTHENILGITPANMYQDYINQEELEGDKSLLSCFILSSKMKETPYTLSVYELNPRKFDNSIISKNLDKYFKDVVLKDLYNNESLIEYQGYFSYNVTDRIKNFIDAPALLLEDTEFSKAGVQIVLENSEFIPEGNLRTFWQRLKVLSLMENKKPYMRIFERVVQQMITTNGMIRNKAGRWQEQSIPTTSEKLNPSVAGKFDYLSLAGTKKTYNAKDFEETFSDTPLKTYKYYGLPLDKNHPLLKKLEEKNTIISVTKGTVNEKTANQYETVIKLTIQDEYAEIQFRRLMRFDYKDFDSKVGGRSKATYISPWAYVYYTVRDDSAPDDYEKNPNQGIDQKFLDIINKIYETINNLDKKYEKITNNLNQKIDNIDKKYENITNQLKKDIQNINNQLKQNNVAMEKVLNNLKNMSGIWVQTGDTVLEGDFKKDTGIAGGNISAFGQDESHYIRTGKNRDNDLMGGV